MARLPRLIIPHQPHFVIQQAIDQQWLFREAEDYRRFLHWLHESAKMCKVAIHAYVLLPGQLQLLATPIDGSGLATCLQRTGRYYVPWYNAKYGRSGTLFAGRFKTAVLEAPAWLLPCSLYMEAAPQRAGLAADAAEYAWSSAAHHAGLRADALLTDHRLVWDLGNTPFQREAAWKALAERGLGGAQVAAIEASVLKGWPLGSEAFKAELQRKASWQVLPAKRGRPAKPAKATSGDAPIDSVPN